MALPNCRDSGEVFIDSPANEKWKMENDIWKMKWPSPTAGFLVSGPH
jgi:hypothetical protein